MIWFPNEKRLIEERARLLERIKVIDMALETPAARKHVFSVKRSQTREIYEAIKSIGAGEVRAADVAKAFAISDSHAGVVLRRLVEAHYLRKTEKGRFSLA